MRRRDWDVERQDVVVVVVISPFDPPCWVSSVRPSRTSEADEAGNSSVWWGRTRHCCCSAARWRAIRDEESSWIESMATAMCLLTYTTPPFAVVDRCEDGESPADDDGGDDRQWNTFASSLARLP